MLDQFNPGEKKRRPEEVGKSKRAPIELTRREFLERLIKVLVSGLISLVIGKSGLVQPESEKSEIQPEIIQPKIIKIISTPEGSKIIPTPTTKPYTPTPKVTPTSEPIPSSPSPPTPKPTPTPFVVEYFSGDNKLLEIFRKFLSSLEQLSQDKGYNFKIEEIAPNAYGITLTEVNKKPLSMYTIEIPLSSLKSKEEINEIEKSGKKNSQLPPLDLYQTALDFWVYSQDPTTKSEIREITSNNGKTYAIVIKRKAGTTEIRSFAAAVAESKELSFLGITGYVQINTKEGAYEIVDNKLVIKGPQAISVGIINLNKILSLSTGEEMTDFMEIKRNIMPGFLEQFFNFWGSLSIKETSTEQKPNVPEK